MTSHPAASPWKFFAESRTESQSVRRRRMLIQASFDWQLCDSRFSSRLFKRYSTVQFRTHAFLTIIATCLRKQNLGNAALRKAVSTSMMAMRSFPTIETSLEILSTRRFRWYRNAPARCTSPWIPYLAPWQKSAQETLTGSKACPSLVIKLIGNLERPSNM